MNGDVFPFGKDAGDDVAHGMMARTLDDLLDELGKELLDVRADERKPCVEGPYLRALLRMSPKDSNEFEAAYPIGSGSNFQNSLADRTNSDQPDSWHSVTSG